MERLIECYAAASRAAIDAIDRASDPDPRRRLHALLPELRERVSCRVCRKPADRSCADGFACSECKTYDEQTADDPTFDVVLQCYRELCALIYTSSLYGAMRSRPEDAVLVELITEAIGVQTNVPRVNGGEPNGGAVVEPDSSMDVKPPPPPPVLVEMRSTKRGAKKKKNVRRGCRCGNATTTPGKLTCFGQRCPCYTEQKPCDRCKCRGCRNPRQQSSNEDGRDTESEHGTRRKPVTIELVSSLQPSHIVVESNPTYSSYIMHDVLEFPSNGQNYEQSGTEVTLGPVNSIFRSS